MFANNVPGRLVKSQVSEETRKAFFEKEQAASWRHCGLQCKVIITPALNKT
jgi:hypothetical protein